MPDPLSEEAKREAFLATPRLAILMMNRTHPAPIGVPVWFDWNGSKVEMFAEAGTPKVRRLQRDPNASVVVTNAVGEAAALQQQCLNGTTNTPHSRCTTSCL